MAIQDRLFSLAAKVIQVISLKNVAIWSLAAVVAIAGYTIFENRAAIVSYVVNGPEADAPQTTSFEMSETSKGRVRAVVDSNDLISSVVVLNADIRNNRRVPIFWYSDDPSIQKQLDGLYSGRYGGIPLFTSDEKNNETIVGVINGEFACGSYTDSGSSALLPGLASRIPYICRTSLPPYYGQFSGYITIGLNRIPDAAELDSLKAETLNLSTEIYFRDVLPSSKKLQSQGK